MTPIDRLTWSLFFWWQKHRERVLKIWIWYEVGTIALIVVLSILVFVLRQVVISLGADPATLS